MHSLSSPLGAAALIATFVACSAAAIAQPLPPKRPHNLAGAPVTEVTRIARTAPSREAIAQTTTVSAHGDNVKSLVSLYAQRHGVPESLAHRIVVRESRYNPTLRGRAHYGLMQISLPTARQMGYTGAPQGLLDPETNLAYGMPYLANAWIVSGGSEARATSLYSSGYYYDAKRKGLIRTLRNARSAPVDGGDAEALAAAQ